MPGISVFDLVESFVALSLGVITNYISSQQYKELLHQQIEINTIISLSIINKNRKLKHNNVRLTKANRSSWPEISRTALAGSGWTGLVRPCGH